MGIGLIVVGMSHLGFTISLGEHGAGRRWMVTHEHVSLPFYMDGQREGGGGSEALARTVMDATDAMR